MGVISPCLSGNEKKHWWLSNRKIVEKYVKDARILIASHEQSDIYSALSLLDSALAISPRSEQALELKARSLIDLRHFKEVANMLENYIPSLKMANDDSSSENSSQQFSRERVKLLSSNNLSSDSEDRDPSFKCFSVSDFKKKIMAGLRKNCEKEGQWRYLILGQACCHLGLMEDAMALLQTGKRLASAAFRRESKCWSDDRFQLSNLMTSNDSLAPDTPPRIQSESATINQLLSQIKSLLRPRRAALAAMDAGLFSEAIRNFSKIVDGRRGSPQGFLAECYMHRASAHRQLGRIADAIADCNRALALEPSCIQALDTRAFLFETIRSLPDCLHDLEHLKLLYNSILRDRKLPGPAWKRQYVSYREIPGKLCALTVKINELKQRVASGETGNVDYYALIGLRRGCSRSELERTHRFLYSKHKPDKAIGFIDKCKLADDHDIDSIKDRANMFALLLYRLLQKGYSNVMSTIMDEEAAEKQRKKVSTALPASTQLQQQTEEPKFESESKPVCYRVDSSKTKSKTTSCSNSNASVFQGVFCRDSAEVGNSLSQAGFNRPLPVKT